MQGCWQCCFHYFHSVYSNCFVVPHCELDDLDTCASFGMKEIVISSMYYSLKWNLRCLRCFFLLIKLVFLHPPPTFTKPSISIFQSSIFSISPDQGKSRFKGWQRNFSLYSCTFIWWMFSGLGRGTWRIAEVEPILWFGGENKLYTFGWSTVTPLDLRGELIWWGEIPPE